MTDLCGLLEDRMPDVAAGRAAWTAEERAHLAGCAECGAAWEVVRRAAALGRGVEARYDAGRVAARVGAALRAPAPTRRRGAWIALAAAAAVAVVLFRGDLPRPGAAPGVADVRLLPELDSLTTEELALLSDELQAPLGETGIVETPGLEELDTTQLERVIRSLEG
ncbi:MAG TPA: hypothetical protein VFS07_05800 [Gemmatimonadales bacterium]|jgi:hypothetical protein|nr:hypothetical protein [Gemmatimonadales bacterium]